MPLSPALRRFFTAGERSDQPPTTSPWASPAVRRMFWVGLILRLLYMTLAHTYRFRVAEDHFQFGWEMGRIARALVTGYGYADPFAGHTGPTAWTPPLYPLILAAAFKLFGVYTNAAAWAVLALNSLFSALTIPAIYELATRCYGSRPDGRNVPLWSGWLWALYPAALQYSVKWPWEMALTCCLFTWALVYGLRLRGIGSPPETTTPARNWVTWATFGLLWGLISVSNSSLLTFLPFEAAWILWPAFRTPRTELLSTLQRAALALLIFAACLAPWMIRNSRAFHAFVPMRTNFGAEFYVAADPAFQGFPIGTVLPLSMHMRELQEYARMGERAYSIRQGQRARAIIAADPAAFLEKVLLRIQFFWASVPHPLDHGLLDEVGREANYAFLSISGLLGLALSLRRRIPGAILFAMAFLTVPLIYYLVTVQARFRHPLEPLIDIFTVYLFQNADRNRLWSGSAPAASPRPIPRIQRST